MTGVDGCAWLQAQHGPGTEVFKDLWDGGGLRAYSKPCSQDVERYVMRYVFLAASVLIQTCIGGLYAWSEFVPALKTAHNLTTAQTQLVFGCLIAVFTVSMVCAGRLLNRLSPAWVAGAGGILFGGGYLTASCSGGNFYLLLLGIGLLAGLGTGFCYVCPLAICAKWFPERKGLATGIAVAGFGGGAVVLAYLGEILFSRGLDVLAVFRWIGLLYGGLILLAALPLRLPPSQEEPGEAIRFAALVRDRYFWGLSLGMLAGTFAGLLVIGNLKLLILSRGIDSAAATAAISAFAVSNALGRVAWGWGADRLRARAVPLSLAFLAGSLLLTGVLLHSRVGAVGLSALIGFGFGACFVVYAAQVGSHYGVDHVGAVYPLVFLAYGLSGLIGPWAGGAIYDSTKSYMGSILASAVIVICGAVGSCWLMSVRPKRTHDFENCTR